jgi:hypothetical protein
MFPARTLSLGNRGHVLEFKFDRKPGCRENGVEMKGIRFTLHGGSVSSERREDRWLSL